MLSSWVLWEAFLVPLFMAFGVGISYVLDYRNKQDSEFYSVVDGKAWLESLYHRYNDDEQLV